MPKVVAAAAIGGQLEALLGDRRARDAATQSLQPLAVAAGHGRARMDVDATNFGERVVGLGLRSLPFALEVIGEHEPPAPLPAAALSQLDLFAPITTESAPPPQGRVIVRGRIDLVWIDDDGQINVVDWQYARRPSDHGVISDPQDIAGFRRLTQAWALRRLWGASVPLRAGAVFLRELEAEPGLIELDAGTQKSLSETLPLTSTALGKCR